MSDKILFAIIGTGKGNASYDYGAVLENILQAHQNQKLVLFASEQSSAKAEDLKHKHPAEDIEIYQFPNEDMEFDADKCFEFFATIINRYEEDGYTSDNMIIDFTHGTKPMSAALYAIGMLKKISNFQYLTRKKDNNGTLSDKESEIKVFNAAYARWLAKIEEARILFRQWQFDAAKTLLSLEKVPNALKSFVDHILLMADLYSALDRLDYAAAWQQLSDAYENGALEKGDCFCCFPEVGVNNAADDTNEFVLPQDFCDYVEALAQTLTDRPTLFAAEITRNKNIMLNLMVDLYANGLRRLESGQTEDALIRCYRLVEMLGQYYLLSLKGWLPTYIPSQFAAQAEMQPTSKPYLQLGREKIVTLLKNFGFDTKQLKDLGKKAEKRNQSILIHGFASQVKDKREIRKIFDEIKLQLNKIPLTSVEEKLKLATFINNFRK
jgi:hypothetical protein